MRSKLVSGWTLHWTPRDPEAVGPKVPRAVGPKRTGPAGSAAAAAILLLAGATACVTNDDGVDDEFFDGEFFPDPPSVGLGPSVIPRDARTQSAVPPPPISGGHLEVSADGAWLVAADPDRDQVYVVARDEEQQTLDLRATIELDPASEPGRVAVQAPLAVVALRRSSEIAVIDLSQGELRGRHPTCVEPRGVAFDGTDVHVACASGQLWTHDVTSLAPVRQREVALDLRDVVVAKDRLFVSTFRDARVLELNDSGDVVVDFEMPTSDALAALGTNARPHVAWRMRAAPDGSLLIVHQAATNDEISTEVQGGYGGGIVRTGLIPCSNSIVAAVVSRVVPGEGVQHAGAIMGSALVVDVAVHPVADRVAFANPTVFGPGAPVQTVTLPPATDAAAGCLGVRTTADGGRRGATSVAYAPNGDLFTLYRDPARIVSVWTGEVVELDAMPVTDTGHDVFHAVTNGNLACASCHPEGGDDAHTWRFQGLGPRRTQTLRGGILDTAPFHWDGEFAQLDDLAHDVFSQRMSGGEIQGPQVDLLGAWMDTLPPLTPVASSNAAASARGRAIFERSSTACASCHADDRRGGPGSHAVGTGGPFQVPALEGLRYRFPLMHDGCAERLEDRFDPACGGQNHGQVDDLTPAELSDLSAYLMSL